MNRLVLEFLNVFFLVFHTALLFFNVFGWIPRRTRRWNLYCLLATFFSWLVLGLWKGIGYCICTDWHWQVREALGYQNVDHSYIDFLIRQVVNDVPDPNLTRTLAGWTFAIVGVMSIALNILDRRRIVKPAMESPNS